MPTTDLTSNYLAQAAPGIAQVIGQLFDPRQRIAIDQARQQRELFPLQRDRLQGQTALDAARAMTEGSRQGLYGAQTAEQQAITGFRNQLGNAFAPQMPQPQQPDISGAVNGFNDALRTIPGAPPPLPQVAPLMEAPQSPGGQPNPLLPAPNGTTQSYDPRHLGALAAAIDKNPSPEQVMSMQAQAEFLNGGVNENRARELHGVMGNMPNINTAITTPWQAGIIDNKNGAAMDRTQATVNGAMERTVVQQEGANKRSLAGAMMKAMHGAGSPQDVKYTEQRKMATDAGGAADRVFQINRDPNGNPSSALGVDLPPEVVAQRDQLSKRIHGYLMIGKTLGMATDLANQDLFGSMNTSDPKYFNRGSGSTFGFGGHPFSAVNANPNAMGEVDRTANEAFNGPSSVANAFSLLGIGAPAMQQSTQPEPPQIMGPPAPPKADPYAILPSNSEMEQSKKNKDEANKLRAQVAHIEKTIQEGAIYEEPAPGWAQLLFPGGKTDLSQNHDARNALVKQREELLKKISALDPESGGNGGNVNDAIGRYSSP